MVVGFKEDPPGPLPSGITGKREQNQTFNKKDDHEYRLAILRAGRVGAFLGGSSTIAALAALVVVGVFCFIAGASAVADAIGGAPVSAVLDKIFNGSLGIIGIALGFLFGRGHRDS